MAVTMSDYPNVKQRASELRCNVPSGVTVLPKNFETARSKAELVQENTAPTVRALLRKAGINETRLERDQERFPYSLHESFDWVAPVIFVTASWLSANPDLLPNALSLIGDYLVDRFKGNTDLENVRLTVVAEKTPDRDFKKLEYVGPPDRIKELMPAILAVVSDERED